MQCHICRRTGKPVGKAGFVLCERCIRGVDVYKEYMYRKRVYRRSRIQSITRQALKKFFKPIREEVYFLWCVNPETQALLPYDFYIPQIRTLIEVQGLEHYQRVEAFHATEADFTRRVYLDLLKRDLADENGYNFLEVDCRAIEDKWSIIKLLCEHVSNGLKYR